MPGSSGPALPAGPGNTAHLRVYEPLAAFPGPERARWESYAAAARAGGTLMDSATAVRTEHVSALRAVLAPTLDVAEEHALVRNHDGLSFICPLDTQRRVWEALAEFRTGLADVIADAFVPRALAEDAEAQLADWRNRGDLRPAHVMSATWQVPIHWFMLVDADERALILGSDRADPSRSLRYQTTMAAARRRAARARSVMQRHFPDTPPVRGIELVSRWLEEFHPHSRVELDYGDLVHLMPDDFLQTDTSVADIAEGLSKLREGDMDAAAAAHDRFVRRWNPVSARENAS